MKYLKLHFSTNGITFTYLDDSQILSVGTKLDANFFKVYICEKPRSVLLPLRKATRILALETESTSTLTITMDDHQNSLRFRFYNTGTLFIMQSLRRRPWSIWQYWRRLVKWLAKNINSLIIHSQKSIKFNKALTIAGRSSLTSMLVTRKSLVSFRNLHMQLLSTSK